MNSIANNTVAVVDYGMAQALRSVSQAVQHAKPTRWACRSSSEVATTRSMRKADARSCLPGQGAMRDCMRELARIRRLQDVAARGGRQQDAPGDGRVRRRCRCCCRIAARKTAARPMAWACCPGKVVQASSSTGPARRPTARRFKVPQMGWNQRAARRSGHRALGQASTDGSLFLLRAQLIMRVPGEPRGHHRRGRLRRDLTAASIARDNLVATQFHPEKERGRTVCSMYRNFHPLESVSTHRSFHSPSTNRQRPCC